MAKNKSIVKRLSAFTAAISLLLTFGAVNAAAGEEPESAVIAPPPTGKYDILPYELTLIELDEDICGDMYFEAAFDLQQSYFGSNAYNFYSILTAAEKKAYDYISDALLSDPTKTSISMPGLTLNDSAAVFRALYAFDKDHPECFWIRNQYSAKGNSKSITLNTDFCDGQSADTVKASVAKFNAKVDEIVNNAKAYSTDYEKMKYFAEYLCDTVVYDNVAADTHKGENSWNAYGALISGSGVCESYAEAFKVLCDKVGIPCSLIMSSSHEWNTVYMDGAWYYVDVTWMDGRYADEDNTPFYDFEWFMTGTDRAAKNDTKGSHTPDATSDNLTYPTVSKTDYDAPVTKIKIDDKFPDKNFRSFIKSKYDENDDGYLSLVEIKEARSINCSYQEIENFAGIEYLENAIWIYAYGNNASFIDFSKNKLVKAVNYTGTGEITVYGSGTYNLSNLSSNFDPAKASDWSGAECDSANRKLINISGNKISYTYNYGKGITVKFTINVKYSGEVIIGDVDESGETDVGDVIELAKCIVNDDIDKFGDSVDFDGDGLIDVGDVIALAKMIVES